MSTWFDRGNGNGNGVFNGKGRAKVALFEIENHRRGCYGLFERYILFEGYVFDGGIQAACEKDLLFSREMLPANLIGKREEPLLLSLGENVLSPHGLRLLQSPSAGAEWAAGLVVDDVGDGRGRSGRAGDESWVRN